MKKIIPKAHYLDQMVTSCETLSELLSVSKALVKKYGPDASIQFDAGYEFVEEVVVVHLQETDEEYAKRLELEEKYKVSIEEQELKELHRLQQKYNKS